MTSVPALAAITLDPKGGGVAAVSRLLWRAFKDEWGGQCRLVSLVGEGAASIETAMPRRLEFGVRLAWAQTTGQCRWTLYSHLALARAQQFIPSPARRPYAIFLHGIEAWRTLSHSQVRALRGASALLANSSFTAGRVAAAHPGLPVVTVCPLALDPAGESESVAPHGGDQSWGPHAVLLVGRMAAAERYKGHDELLDAWPSVVAAVPDAKLVFVGDGDDAPRLLARARDLGLSATVIMTGFLDRRGLDAAYRTAAVFAMPSRNEGFGLVYLEAMSRGLACVASRQDAAVEVVEDGATGFLVDQTDVSGLANRLVRLLTDAGLRRQMGERGRLRARAAFSYAGFRHRIVTALADAFSAPSLDAAAEASEGRWR